MKKTLSALLCMLLILTLILTGCSGSNAANTQDSQSTSSSTETPQPESTENDASSTPEATETPQNNTSATPEPLDVPTITPIPSSTPTPDSGEEETDTDQGYGEVLSADEVKSLWNQLEGVWTNGKVNFVMFIIDDNYLCYNTADWYSEFGRNNGYVSKVVTVSNRIYECYIDWPEQHSEEGDYEAETTTITIDLGAKGDNKIDVKIVSNGSFSTFTYVAEDFQTAMEKVTAE